MRPTADAQNSRASVCRHPVVGLKPEVRAQDGQAVKLGATWETR